MGREHRQNSLAAGVILAFAELRQALDHLSSNPDTPMAIIHRGVKVTLIPAIYGALGFITRGLVRGLLPIE